ncbi:DUF4139 domain-containing protein [Marinobacter piscensis]|uniref:DUF4139 domain-containing protein n=1 Tax=Marinobacter piscensis TaxID=1562308 RepID=UPI0011A2628F|nr:mucoidy inhibitor MuiA family protein [Marinobacter piscensis]
MKVPSLLAFAIATAPLVAYGDITSATLYPSHAQLTWAHTAQINAGAGTVEISGLPVSLQNQSLYVVVDGVADAQIRQVQVQRVEQSEFVAEETRELRDKLAKVTLRIQEQEDEIRAWNQQLTLMSSAAESPRDVPVSELNTMAQTLRESTRGALTEIRNIREQMADDQALKDRLERELTAAKQKARATKTVQVRYQASEGGQLQVHLKFQTPEARWFSEYTARLNTDPENPASGNVALEHIAVVEQSSGLDWENIELQLSTASARSGTEIPPVNAWIVSPEQPQAYRAKASAPAADSESASLMGNVATVEQQSIFAQQYRLHQATDIPSGASAQRLTVSTHQVPVNVATWTVPVMDTAGYVQATGLFETGMTLPSGRVTLFRDGQSVGENRLPSLADGEELTLGFGVDQGVRVEVINELERSGEEGIWKSENVQRRQNRFEVTNHHKQAVQVRILDRLPVSQEDILTVKPLDISEPVRRDVENKKGVLAWDRKVPAGETVSVQSGFEVRVPEGTSLPRL